VTRRGIVLAGTACLDVVNLIDAWPEEEQIAFIRERIPAAGGPPHNAAAGLVKLEAPFPVELICLVGDDAYGDVFRDTAKAYGLKVEGVRRVAAATTDYTLVMTSKATGRRTFFFHPGANDTMTAEQILPDHDGGRIYYLGSPGISASMDRTDGWRSALRAMRGRGWKTAMELCPVPPELQAAQVRPCLPLLDYFIVNDSEAEIVSGLPVLSDGRFDASKAGRACARLLEMGVGDMAAIHHPDGAVALRRDGEKAHAASVAVPREEIAGTVGAGDAFYAGMLFGLHEDWPLEKCLALANAAAATSLHSPTTSAAIRPWAACLAYAAEKGLRRAMAQA
jgi:sugar/nucleoside kinase (ribokinase family)